MPDVDIDLIRPSPYQPRLYFEREDLKRSVERDGMPVPILIREKPDENTKYEIIDGERRWLAAKDIGWGKVPVDIRNVDDETARRMVYTLNEERQPYGSEENTKFFRRMYDEMGTVYAVSKAFNRPASTIWNYINLSILPEYLQKATWAGKIKMGEISELEPLFTEAREEIGNISSTLNYQTSPTYQKIVAGCEAIYKGEIKGREEVREHITDPYLEALDRARIDRAKKVIEEKAPTPTDFPEATVKLETPEDFERASEALKKEAQRRKTPEQKAEEQRKKLVAEARRSLHSTAKKIEHASQVMDVSEFREHLTRLEETLESNPADAKAQLISLGQQVTEAEDKAKAEAKAKQEEEKRQQKAEEERRREERADKEAREKYKQDKAFIQEALKAMPEEEVAEMLNMVPILGKVKKVKSVEQEFNEIMKMASKVVDNLEKLKREGKLLEQVNLKQFSITLRILADCLDEFAKLAEGRSL